MLKLRCWGRGSPPLLPLLMLLLTACDGGVLYVTPPTGEEAPTTAPSSPTPEAGSPSPSSPSPGPEPTLPPFETPDPTLPPTPDLSPRPTLEPTQLPEPSLAPSPTPELWPLNTTVDPTLPWRSGVATVSDTGGGRMSIVRLSDSALLWDFKLNDDMPDRCGPTRPCQVHELERRVIEDDDHLDIAISIAPDNYSELHRLKLRSPAKPVWSLKDLDFSKVVQESRCNQPPQSTCASSQLPPGSYSMPWECRMWFVHAFEVLEDRPDEQKISMMIADHHGRLVSATLDYANGNTCAVVDQVINSNTPGWDESCQPNEIQMIDEPDGRYMLVTCRNIANIDGMGRLVMFKQSQVGSTGRWEYQWMYPDPASSSAPFLNTPHHGRLDQEADGSYVLRYAHTRGQGTGWGKGSEGTLGFATLTHPSLPPDYLTDYTWTPSAEQRGFQLVKSLNPMPGNAWMVADGGEASINVPGTTGFYVLGVGAGVLDQRSGAWSSEHTMQQLLELPGPPLATVNCAWTMLYSAAWEGRESLGRYLREEMDMPGTSCRLVEPPRPTRQAD